jgi:hypothetical protein
MPALLIRTSTGPTSSRRRATSAGPGEIGDVRGYVVVLGPQVLRPVVDSIAGAGEGDAETFLCELAGDREGYTIWPSGSGD